MNLNIYAEKILEKNQLISPTQMKNAKSALEANPGRFNLLEIMLHFGYIEQALVDEITQRFEQREKKPASAPPPVSQNPSATHAVPPPPIMPDFEESALPDMQMDVPNTMNVPNTANYNFGHAANTSTPSMPSKPSMPPMPSMLSPSMPSGLSVDSGAASCAVPKVQHAPQQNYVGEQTTNYIEKSSHEEVDLSAMSVTSDTSVIDKYLRHARESQASDVHINTGYPVTVRKNGRLVAFNKPPLEDHQAQEMLFSILSYEQRQQALKDKYIEFCYNVDGERYRACLLKQRCGWNGAFRIIGDSPSTIEDLGLPDKLKRLTEYHQGLVLIAGPKGCGKSTTLAALVEYINKTREEHIITIEDPIEYIFSPSLSHISQREVISHTKTFSAALRAALREDPDIIMIGELRDLETMSLAISASETGHLVLATLHTTSAARTIDQILDTFPPDQQNQIRSMISESIKGIICQQLLPRKNGQGRVLALEIMLNTPAISNLIRERKLPQMSSVMQMGKKQGMITMDESLMDLVNAGIIEGSEAYLFSDNKKIFSRWKPEY